MTEAIIANAGAVDARGAGFEIREWSHGAMDGPPLHVHHSDDEAWHVLEGSLHFRFRDETTDAPAGTTVFVPAGVAHTYGCPGDARYLIISTPRVFALIEALHAEGLAPEDLASVYSRYDSEIVE